MNHAARALLRVASVLVCAGPAVATDVYVDAVTGSNLTGDGSTSAPWQTIGHALAAIPVLPLEPHTIHVAPGLYDAALGEPFPLVLRPMMRLVSEAGSTATTIAGDGAPVPLILMESDPDADAFSFGPDTLVEGFALRDAEAGVFLDSDWLLVGPTLRDLDVRGMRWGIRLQTFGQGGEGETDPVIESVVLSGNTDEALRLIALGGNCRATLRDSVVEANVGHGMRLGNFSGTTRLTLEDSFVLQNGGDGIFMTYTNEGTVELDAHGCVIAGNTLAGLRNNGDSGLGGIGTAALRRSTITGNQVGIESLQDMGMLVTDLSDSIVWGNDRDIRSDGTSGAVRAGYCDIGGGQVVDLGGNFSADPRFWNAADFDFHLRADSPCIDAGNPASPLDADGSVADVGAFVFDPAFCGDPQVYCTAKTNSQGCVAAVHFVGPPSLTSSATMEIWATEVLSGKTGLLFYGTTGPAALPFLGGVLCALPPLRRTPPVTSGGNAPDDCTGVLRFDFTSWLSSGSDPLLVLGTPVYAQFWYRDPDDAVGIGLSDAVAFEVCP